MNQLNKLKLVIINLYAAVEKLNMAFPGKPFTPDGRIVGDIGEAIAAIEFSVILDEKLQQHWDGHRIDSSGNKRYVQIKTTQRDETYLKKPPRDGDLLVFKISKDGDWKCLYDGEILPVWDSLSHKKQNKSGEKLIKLKSFEGLKSR